MAFSRLNSLLFAIKSRLDFLRYPFKYMPVFSEMGKKNPQIEKNPLQGLGRVPAPVTASIASVASISLTDMLVCPSCRRIQVMKSGLIWPILRQCCTLALVMSKWSIEFWMDFLGIVHWRIRVTPGKKKVGSNEPGPRSPRGDRLRIASSWTTRHRTGRR